MKIYENCQTILESLTSKTVRISSDGDAGWKCVLLSKADCYFAHKLIKEKFEGTSDVLTWDNGLIFNCEHYTHEDMYKNLFKLKFFGVNLGQED